MTTPPQQRSFLHRAARRLPSPLRDPIWRLTVGRRSPVRWGNLRRTEPFSRTWGSERGLPLDRVYIEDFLRRHAEDIRGEALEVHSAYYLGHFGGRRVSTIDVLDVDPANSRATIVGDLSHPDTLAADRFDSVVLTQTLQFVRDVDAAVANVYRSLVPGGVLLLTVPGITQEELGYDDFWRWTANGLAELLARSLPPGAEREVEAHGNVLTSIAFLMGLSAADLDETELAVADPMYPLILCARVRKPS